MKNNKNTEIGDFHLLKFSTLETLSRELSRARMHFSGSYIPSFLFKVKKVSNKTNKEINNLNDFIILNVSDF